MTQYEKILTALKKAGNKGMTNAELQQLWITCPHKRIAEMRAKGHNITWRYKPWGNRFVAVYKLVKEAK